MNENTEKELGEEFDKIADIYDDNLSELLAKYNVGGGTDKFAEY